MKQSHHNKHIGALTIGQAPRPDLVSPLEKMLPNNYEIIQSGALDNLGATDLPAVNKSTYPLSTQLRDGTLVMIEEAFLVARLQQALDRLEAQDVTATILLCAGTFKRLQGIRPLFKPFTAGLNILNVLGMRRIGLITPIKEQEKPIQKRWQTAGFDAFVWTAVLTQQNQTFNDHLNQQIKTHNLDCILLDYVGHPAGVVEALQETAVIPIIDLGQLAMAALVSSL
ncbi:MAG: AroM family protein [Chloroflexi bacterium]|nr:AroM family protein [Chloroflexota bacterium]